MRFIYGQGWVHGYEDENDGDAAGGGDPQDAGDSGDDPGAAGEDDDGDAAGGNGDDGGEPGDGGAAGDGAAASGAGKEPKGSMLDAINKKLGYAKDEEGKEGATGDGSSVAAGNKETATHFANGKPKKDAAGNELNDQGQITKAAAPAKPKTSAELSLSQAELAALQPKTRQRFHDMTNSLKAAEANVAKLTESNTTLAKARDSILGLMEETRTSSDALGALLEFNMLASSEDPKDLKSALDMMNAQRADLMRRLGIVDAAEEDPFKDYPDLQKEVDEDRLSRERALEIVGKRRADAEANKRREQQSNSQRQQSERQSAAKAAGTKAMSEIDAWERALSTSDLDYAAKRGILMAPRDGQPSMVDEVLQNYPPDRWLSTLKLLYAGVNVQRAPITPRGNRPIRPTGVRPGAKKAGSMQEAIDGALGYKK